MKRSNFFTYFFLLLVTCGGISYAEDPAQTVVPVAKGSLSQTPLQAVKEAVVDVAHKIGEQPAEVAENVKELYAEMKKLWFRLPKWARYATYGGVITISTLPVLLMYVVNRLSAMSELKERIHEVTGDAVKSTLEHVKQTLKNKEEMAEIFDAARQAVGDYVSDRWYHMTRPVVDGASLYTEKYATGAYGWF